MRSHKHINNIEIIKRIITETTESCGQLWALTNETCSFRDKKSHEGTISCKFPERINYIGKDNCTYSKCPLIHYDGGI